MRYLIIILTLASLLALMACGNTSIMPVDDPDTTGSSSRDTGNGHSQRWNRIHRQQQQQGYENRHSQRWNRIHRQYRRE